MHTASLTLPAAALHFHFYFVPESDGAISFVLGKRRAVGGMSLTAAALTCVRADRRINVMRSHARTQICRAMACVQRLHLNIILLFIRCISNIKYTQNRPQLCKQKGYSQPSEHKRINEISARIYKSISTSR